MAKNMMMSIKIYSKWVYPLETILNKINPKINQQIPKTKD